MIVMGLHTGRGASVALVKDGQPLVLLERERLVRRKQADGLELAEVEAALREAGLVWGDVEACAVVPSSHKPEALDVVQARLGQQLVSVDHALAHAAAAYYSSPFEAALVLVRDPDCGKSHSFIGRGGALEPLACHSGAGPYLYNRVANAMGLGAAGGAGKLMGLAPYGRPVFYQEADRARVVKAEEQAVLLWLELVRERALAAGYEGVAIAEGMNVLSPFARDLAASTQLLFERDGLAVIKEAQEAVQREGSLPCNLCLSGGAALNCPANSLVATQAGFDALFIPPFCDDTGLALGAALLVCAQKTEKRALSAKPVSPYLGRCYDDTAVHEVVRISESGFQRYPCADPIKQAALWLAEGKIIGWFEGRSEVGPRALGHRSILASPLLRENWERINKIKQREPWRPFAPAVLEEKAGDWFSGAPLPSPAMLFTHQVLSDKLPAITHVDGSARVQTVTDDAGHFYQLLKAFEAMTGVPVLLNTS
ncbi:MAG: carbamoyltransferase C-terminal domain-containing protein, partial [Alphaproteobacteria bacterium]|nr:carbamoyltransferase C-terminal domain-containing protein [Alphaproteobacteria bacterium]